MPAEGDETEMLMLLEWAWSAGLDEMRHWESESMESTDCTEAADDALDGHSMEAAVLLGREDERSSQPRLGWYGRTLLATEEADEEAREWLSKLGKAKSAELYGEEAEGGEMVRGLHEWREVWMAVAGITAAEAVGEVVGLVAAAGVRTAGAETVRSATANMS